MSTQPRQAVTLELQRALRIAVASIVVVILLVQSLPRILLHLDDFRLAEVQLAGWSLFVSVALTEVVLAVRGRSWGRARWAAAVGAVGVDVAMFLTLPDVQPLEAETAYGVVGWLGLAVFLDRPLRLLLAFLTVHVTVSTILLVLSTAADNASFTEFGLVSVAILTMQIAVGLAGTTVRRIARESADTAAKAEELQTRERIAEVLHGDRRQRYEELGRSVGPILEGLITGELDPGMPHTQLTCAIEAARLRRLFAETDDTENRLLHEIEAAIDVAERRGVLVTMVTSGRPPALPLATRRMMTEPVLTALASARTRARVSVIGTPDSVSASVVSDPWTTGGADPVHGTAPGSPDVLVESLQQDDERWVRACWTRDPP